MRGCTAGFLDMRERLVAVEVSVILIPHVKSAILLPHNFVLQGGVEKTVKEVHKDCMVAIWFLHLSFNFCVRSV